MDDTIECPYCQKRFSVMLVTDVVAEAEPETAPEAPAE